MEKLASKLPKGHNLYPLIERCLHNDPPRRPTAIELLHWLQDIQRLELEDFDEAVEYQVHHGAASQVTDQRERMTLLLHDRKFDIDSRQEEDIEYSEVSGQSGTNVLEGSVVLFSVDPFAIAWGGHSMYSNMELEVTCAAILERLVKVYVGFYL